MRNIKATFWHFKLPDHQMLPLAKLDHWLRPLTAKLLPSSSFVKLYSSFRSTFLHSLEKTLIDEVVVENPVTLPCGLTFRNDLGNAAGLDKDGSLLDFNYNIGAGFAVVGTILDKPHTGNLFSMWTAKRNPWTPLPNSHSALNSLGLPSLGVDKALENIADFRKRRQPKDFPIGLSIMGHPTAKNDEEKLVGILDCVKKSLPFVDFIEINESCPNVKHKSDSGLEARLNAIRQLRDDNGSSVPLFVKLGTLGDVKQTLELVARCGFDGLIGLNTQKDYANLGPKLAPGDQKLFKYYTEKYEGGLSGAIIRDISFEQIEEAAKWNKELGLNLTLIHVGGIMERADVLKSREYTPLREWYSGFMEKICTQSLKDVYPDIAQK